MTYHFYFFKWLLLVWTFRIYMVFIVLNHSKCSVFSSKLSHFTINKEGPNNGSTWPLRAKSLKQKNTIFPHLSAIFFFLNENQQVKLQKIYETRKCYIFKTFKYVLGEFWPKKKNKSSIVVTVTSGLLFLKMIDMC